MLTQIVGPPIEDKIGGLRVRDAIGDLSPELLVGLRIHRAGKQGVGHGCEPRCERNAHQPG